MKKIYSIILVFVALFAIQSIANAQPYTEKNHIAYSKYPTGPVDGIYTIHLDTFVTGEKTITETSIPADIVLVLDVSGSMTSNMTTYSYTERTSQGYTYNNYPETPGYYQTDGRYYYKHTDGNYYVVSRGGQRNNRNLSCSIGGTTYYLVGNSIQGNAPTGYGNGDTIWTGVLYTRQTTTQTRIEALKKAVESFVDEIQKNDLYKADGTEREGPLGNQIAIVKFASRVGNGANITYYNDDSNAYLDANGGNHTGRDGSDNVHYTEVVKRLTPVTGNASSIVSAVNAITIDKGATASDFGLHLAKNIIDHIDTDRESTKTVVLFTDGVPTHLNTSFDTNVATAAIENAKSIKDAGATVFTVGVFDNLGNNYTNVTNYMNYVSSNYPNASSMTQGGIRCDDSSIPEDERKDPVFYQDASDADLSTVFRTIAQAAGGSQATTVTAEAATTVDVVSQSFDLPDGAGTEITVHFANCIGVDENGYLIFDEDNLLDNPDEGEEGHVTITIDEASQKVTASGFDYSGNWCGLDESLTTENKYRGMKLMLLIPIEMADDAVGGNAVGTNGPESGIYVNGEPVLKFDIPHIDLPTNLHIKKEGIADGECATFLIYRKPLTPETSSWETTPFKTVIVIGGQHENTVKLMGLDPHYLYKIVEGGWSWSYNLDHVEDFEGNTLTGDITSDKLITNPFIFVNSKKNTKVRHAESAVYNDFRTAGTVAGVDAVGETQKKQETSSESTETK